MFIKSKTTNNGIEDGNYIGINLHIVGWRSLKS